MSQTPILETSVLEYEDVDALTEAFFDNAWTDGLPVVPPTAERVEAMLATVPDAPEDYLGLMPTHWQHTHVHHIAVNSVMAGCKPEYFPIVLAAIKAAMQEPFNLYGVQGTTNPCGVTVLVNGPAVKQLDINGGANVFGQGWRANATIGRAVRLCLINIGGGRPIIGDMATLGDPSKYGLCIAENEDESPWEPYHVEKGHDKDTTLVTVLSAVSPQNLVTMTEDPHALVDVVARAIITSGSNCQYLEQEPMIVLGPTQAHRIAKGGLSKQDVRELLWERGRATLDGLEATDYKAIKEWRAASLKVENGVEYIYPTPDPSGIAIVVAGGHGPHSAVLPTFNGSHICSQPV